MAKRDLTGIAAAASADLQPIHHGRGLAGMLSGPARLDNALLIALDLIDLNPQQARQVFDESGLEELAMSIKAHGVLQPIGVQRVGARYRILFGERRYRAAMAAGHAGIPALVYEALSDADGAILTALENLQREDLDLEDEARQFVRLLELTSLSQRALAEQLGKTHNYVSRRVRLLKERPEIFAAIREGRITQREALEQLADERVYHGDTAGADAGDVYHGDTPSFLTGRNSLGPTRASYADKTLRQMLAFGERMKSLNLAELADGSQRAEVRRLLDHLIEELTALHQMLEGEGDFTT